MVLRLNKSKLIFLTIFLITIGDSNFLIEKGVNSFVEYTAYFLFITGIGYYYVQNKSYKNRSANLYFFLVVALFSVGLCMQSLPFATILRLVFTMIAIAAAAVLAEGYMDSFHLIRTGAYAIFWGTMVTTVLALIGDANLFNSAFEGFISIGYNGGIEHKNYYAADMLGSFMGISLYFKYVKKTKLDLVLLLMGIFCIIVAGSRGVYILLILYLIILNYDKLRFFAKRQRILFALCVMVIAFFVCKYLYHQIALHSGTYLYRVRGLSNYLLFYYRDFFHLIFGNAEMAYGDSIYSYVDRVRSVVGWNGTLELAWLDVVIKNGILGVIGYLIIFARLFFIFFQSRSWMLKTAGLSVLVVLCVSSIVETYMVNVHVVFGIYLYIILSGLQGQIRETKMENRNVLELEKNLEGA